MFTSRIQQNSIERAIQALELSTSTKRYQAIINLMAQARIALPQGIHSYIDDPKIYSAAEQEKIFGEVKVFLPQLIAYFKNEAIAKDKLKLLKNLKTLPSGNLYKNIASHVDTLYSESITKEQYNLSVNELKIIILEQRLHHVLSGPKDLKPYQNIIRDFIDNKRQPKVFYQALLAEFQKNEFAPPLDFHFNYKSYITLRAIDTFEKMHDNHVGKILSVMNQAFKQEILVLNNLKETTLTGREQLYRGIRIEATRENIEKIFNNSHRILDVTPFGDDKKPKNNDLFLYDVLTPWNPSNSTWEVSGVYTSFNKNWSLHFMRQHEEGSEGVMLDIIPSKTKQVMYGSHNFEQEVIFNQLDPSEIRALYVIKGALVTEVHKNPNYEIIGNEKPLAFQVGDNLQEFISVGPQDITSLETVNNYQKVKFDTSHSHSISYHSPEHFYQRYNKMDVAAHRQRLEEKRNYKNFQEKLNACIKKDRYSLDMSVLYLQLSHALRTNNQLEVASLIKDTPIIKGVDVENNNLLMLAAKHKDPVMLDFALRSAQINVSAVNNRKESAFYLALDSGLENIPVNIITSEDKKHIFSMCIQYDEFDIASRLINLDCNFCNEALVLLLQHKESEPIKRVNVGDLGSNDKIKNKKYIKYAAFILKSDVNNKITPNNKDLLLKIITNTFSSATSKGEIDTVRLCLACETENFKMNAHHKMYALSNLHNELISSKNIPVAHVIAEFDEYDQKQNYCEIAKLTLKSDNQNELSKSENYENMPQLLRCALRAEDTELIKLILKSDVDNTLIASNFLNIASKIGNIENIALILQLDLQANQNVIKEEKKNAALSNAPDAKKAEISLLFSKHATNRAARTAKASSSQASLSLQSSSHAASTQLFQVQNSRHIFWNKSTDNPKTQDKNDLIKKPGPQGS